MLLLIGAFSNAALASAVPVFIGQAYDKLLDFQEGIVNADATLSFAVLMVGAIVGSQALRAVLQLMRNFSAEVFAQRIERDVRDELYASLLGKSMTFHDMQPVGDIMARVTKPELLDRTGHGEHDPCTAAAVRDFACVRTD